MLIRSIQSYGLQSTFIISPSAKPPRSLVEWIAVLSPHLQGNQRGPPRVRRPGSERVRL